MTDLRAILTLEPAVFEWKGQTLLLRRPNLIDLVSATEANQKGPGYGRAWAIAAHVMDDQRRPLFESPEAAMQCPLGLALALQERLEFLYSEGSD